eukprot:scaffold37937_cov37-Tisochrysis_lutea.AAC.1
MRRSYRDSTKPINGKWSKVGIRERGLCCGLDKRNTQSAPARGAPTSPSRQYYSIPLVPPGQTPSHEHIVSRTGRKVLSPDASRLANTLPTTRSRVLTLICVEMKRTHRLQRSLRDGPESEIEVTRVPSPEDACLPVTPASGYGVWPRGVKRPGGSVS